MYLGIGINQKPWTTGKNKGNGRETQIGRTG